MKTDKPEATLNITKFGSFTANFKVLPPSIPPEYLIGLFTIVASTMVGWSIPSIIGWINFKKRARVVSSYHQRIKSNIKDDDDEIDAKDIKDLDELKDEIADDYSKGKISDQQFENMNNELSILYQEIYKKKIDSLSDKDPAALNKIKSELADSYGQGKLNELHYNLLKEKISEVKDNRNTTTA